MTDIFFSYSSKDRDRVRPIFEALTALDFDVFWDQQVPTGTDWDTWIKEKLASSRAAVVFWSLSSVASDNVRHEATVAKTQGKLVPVMLDALRVDQFPMGLFNTQAARLMEWTGDGEDSEWKKLLSELHAKAMPAWVARQLALRDEEVAAERRKREAAQARGDAARAQLDKEIAGYDDLRRAREAALGEAEKARAELAGLKEALEAAKTQSEDLSVRLAAAERMASTHRSGVPMWGLVLGLMGALGLGAGGLYLFHTGPLRSTLEGELNRTRSALEERTKSETTIKSQLAEAQKELAPLRVMKAEQDRMEADVRAKNRRLAEQAAKYREECAAHEAWHSFCAKRDYQSCIRESPACFWQGDCTRRDRYPPGKEQVWQGLICSSN